MDRADNAAMPERTAKISVRELTMIYGRNAERAAGMLESGMTQNAIFEASGAWPAVCGVSFDVREHEIFVIMGLSGSGKSSLIKCLNRLNTPISGSVFVNGEDIIKFDERRLRQYRQNIAGMVFQNFGLLPNRDVIGNVEFGLEVCGVPKAERRRKAAGMIELVGLSGREKSRPNELSGGMQQRVGLARALANDPQILLMDEPFSALDPLIRRQMQLELLRLQGILKKTIVFITHDIGEAFMLGDRIAIMREGRFHQIGTPGEILKKPADDYVIDFIKDIDRVKFLRAGDLEMDTFDPEHAPKAVVGLDAGFDDIAAALLEHGVVGAADGRGDIVGVVSMSSILRLFVRNVS